MFEFIDQLARALYPISPWFGGEMDDDTRAAVQVTLLAICLSSILFGILSMIGWYFNWPHGGFTGLIAFGGCLLVGVEFWGAGKCMSLRNDGFAEAMSMISGIICIIF